MLRDDGSYQSSNLPVKSNRHVSSDPFIYKGIVTRVYYVDDDKNVSKGASNQEVMYDVVIIGGNKHGQIISNVRDISCLGGKNNYSEQIWQAAENPNLSRTDGKTLAESDGDVVFIEFLGGSPGYPFILGGGVQFQNKGKTGTKKSDGPRLLFEYNGINVLINNKGELLVTRKGGKATAEKGKFEPGTDEEANFQILDKKVIIKDKNGNQITIDSAAKKITIAAPEVMEIDTKQMKILADNAFSLESQTIHISGDTVIIDGTQILLGGGGPGVARLGDTAVGTGNDGGPVISTIISGSFTVKSG